jgi:hypothetical protein
MTVKYFRRFKGSDADEGSLISEDPTAELYFREAEPGDLILIETLNSKYTFSIIDPAKGKGTLSGGATVERPVVAFLTGALDEGHGGLAIDSNRIKTGARVLFYFDTGNGTKSLILSKVVKLALIKGSKGKLLIA